MTEIFRLVTARWYRASTSLLLIPVVFALFFSGCVEIRARYTPVPHTPTATLVPTAAPPSTPLPPSPTSVVIPTPVPTPVPPTPLPTPVAPTASPEPTPIATAVNTPTVSPITFNLTLDFEGLSDESIVRSDTVLLTGLTSADAIVSVNDIIVEVQVDGSFEITLSLDPGPNFIDVVASNLEGSQINSSLAIISIPSENTQ